VKEIVNNSPFRTPDGTTYIGRKNTLMIEIDPRNGKILQQIDLNKADNQYRMATHSQSQYQPRTIFLGRNGKLKKVCVCLLNRYTNIFFPTQNTK
jgi:hypothetical protein